MSKLRLIKAEDISKAPVKNYRLVRARITKNLSGKDLAKKAGVSRSKYNTIEHLMVCPRKEVKEKIARILDEDLEYLFPEKLEPYYGNKYAKKSKDVLDNLERVELDLKKIIDNRDYEKQRELTDLNEQIMEILGHLGRRKRDVIQDRFGFRNNYTLREAKEKYGVSFERIRQIQVEAIEKLQVPENAKKLIEFKYFNISE